MSSSPMDGFLSSLDASSLTLIIHELDKSLYTHQEIVRLYEDGQHSFHYWSVSITNAYAYIYIYIYIYIYVYVY